MTSQRLAEIDAELQRIGRPAPTGAEFWLKLRGRLEPGANKPKTDWQIWDEQHPGLRARYFELIEQKNALLERERVEHAQAEAIRRARNRCLDAGVGKRSLEAAEGARSTDAATAVGGWLDAQSEAWMVICGARGTGKSVAAAMACFRSAMAGRSVAWTTASEVARIPGFGPGSERMGELKRADLLVIDDFGTESQTDYGRSLLFELLNDRHESYGRTIITSNLSDAEIKSRLGERIVDRIRQSGRLQVVTGASLRTQGAK